MRDFFKKLLTDESGQKFTKNEVIVYGIIVPVVMIVIMGIAGWLETSCV